LENLELELIQLKGPGFILPGGDNTAWKNEISEAVADLVRNGPQDSQWPRNVLKVMDQKQIGLAILGAKIARITQERRGRSIRVKELAQYMGIGVATLYRIYGKYVLKGLLGPRANDKLPTTRDEEAVAKDVKNENLDWHNEN
jgi:hypothetical protein